MILALLCTTVNAGIAVSDGTIAPGYETMHGRILISVIFEQLEYKSVSAYRAQCKRRREKERQIGKEGENVS